MSTNRYRLILQLSIVALVLIALADPASAWPYDPFVNLPVCEAPGFQTFPKAASDGAGGAYVVWQDSRSPLDQLFTVQMLSPSVGYAFGFAGVYWKTTDGWTTYQRNTIPATEDLVRCSFADADTGMVLVSPGNKLLLTADGGAGWSDVTHPFGGPFQYGVAMANGQTAWTTGGAGTIYHTTNAGASWSPQFSGTGAALFDVVFVDPLTGWAVGQGGTIVHTVDGGANWNLQGTPTIEDLWAVDFIDANEGSAVGDNGTMLYTIDGGLIWQNATGATFENFEDVDLGPWGAYAVGGDFTVLFSPDNGATWSPAAGPWNNAEPNGVSVVGSSHATIAGGTGLTVYTNDNGSTWAVQGTGYDVYAQRIDADGNAVWATDGLPVAAEIAWQTRPQIIPDGAGGAIVVWEDLRTGDWDIYGQRIASGSPSGVSVLVCGAPNTQSGPTLVSDAAGGTYIAWEDRRSGEADLYIQRIDDAGTPLWDPDGKLLCGANGTQDNVSLVPDGFGGVIAVWEDGRSGGLGSGVYAQRLLPDGTERWVGAGQQVGTDLRIPFVAPDGFGGALVLWESGAGPESLIAQHVNADYGVLLWPAPGVTITGGLAAIGNYGIISDEVGGAVAYWEDDRSGHLDLYAQRVNAVGDTLWPANGAVVCDVISSQSKPVAVPDGTGGAILLWEDFRYGIGDIFAQCVLGDGSRQWDPNGLLVCGAPFDQYDADVARVTEDAVVAVWQDYRTGQTGIYAQWLHRDGYLRSPAPMINSIIDSPGDQGGEIVTTWAPSFVDAYPSDFVTNYTVWRRIEGSMAPVEFTPDDDATAAGVDPDLAASMAQSGWAYVGSVDAFNLTEYAYDVPTYGDSTGAGIPLTGCMVIAHTDDPLVVWKSEPAVGYSVDNVAPGAPLALAGEAVGVDASLTWDASGVDDEDLGHYAVYRSAVAGFTPGPATFLDTAPDTLYLDTSTGALPFYYKVTAVDIHDNESDPSNEVLVTFATAVGGADQTPRALTLLPNSPNPFESATTLRYGLTAPSDVLIEVFDVAGRRVFAERLDAVGAGWHEYRFAGNDGRGRRLSSGVYFYRLETVEGMLTRKMVIAR